MWCSEGRAAQAAHSWALKCRRSLRCVSLGITTVTSPPAFRRSAWRGTAFPSAHTSPVLVVFAETEGNPSRAPVRGHAPSGLSGTTANRTCFALTSPLSGCLTARRVPSPFCLVKNETPAPSRSWLRKRRWIYGLYRAARASQRFCDELRLERIGTAMPDSRHEDCGRTPIQDESGSHFPMGQLRRRAIIGAHPLLAAGALRRSSAKKFTRNAAWTAPSASPGDGWKNMAAIFFPSGDTSKFTSLVGA